MKVICIANQKGGVGKSTTAAAMGAYLHKAGASVLYIDTDPQNNLGLMLGDDLEEKRANLQTVFSGAVKPMQALRSTAQGDLLPGCPDMEPGYKPPRGRYSLLEILQTINRARPYDYCIIDTTPYLGDVTRAALAAADTVVIPAEPALVSAQGLNKLGREILRVQREDNESLTVAGVLLTRYQGRMTVTKENAADIEEIAALLHTRVFNTRIRLNTDLQKAQRAQRSIFDYAPHSMGAQDYEAFMEEMKPVLEAITG